MDNTLDPAILAVMPRGSHDISVKPRGTSSWSSGYKVDIFRVDGEKFEYFLKAGLVPTISIYLPMLTLQSAC